MYSYGRRDIWRRSRHFSKQVQTFEPPGWARGETRTRLRQQGAPVWSSSPPSSAVPNNEQQRQTFSSAIWFGRMVATGGFPGWYAEECILGIDEAGRGPVLGPMVYGSAFCAASRREELAQANFADSKTLTEEKREALFEDLKSSAWMGSHVESTSAEEISRRMLHPDRESLNKIANEATFALIRAALDDGVHLTEVFVDTVGDADKHRERLEQQFPRISFTVCPKADAIYPIVSAASVVAKVTRDRSMKDPALREAGLQLNGSMGSGYPADPDTKEWLQNNIDPVFGYPSVVRFSWQTTTRLLDARAVDSKWACDEEETQQNRLNFGAGTKGPTAGVGRHSFFRSRKIQRVEAGF